MNNINRTNDAVVTLNLTDLKALLDAAKAALHVADEAVKA